MNKKIKWVIGFIIGIILLLVIYLVVTQKEKYFDRIELPQTTMVVNKTQLNYLDSIVYVGISELHLTPTVIVLRELTDKNQPTGDIEDLKLMAYIQGKNHQYILNIRKMSRDNSLTVISHELIHLLQREEERFIAVDGKIIFQDIEYTIENMPDYKQRPWEVEAYSKQSKLRKKIEKVLYQSRK